MVTSEQLARVMELMLLPAEKVQLALLCRGRVSDPTRCLPSLLQLLSREQASVAGDIWDALSEPLLAAHHGSPTYSND